MKTKRCDYHIPSEQTVCDDVKKTFVQAGKRIANLLQEYEGPQNIAMDTWTS